jgi:hypothetical protein
MYCGEADVMEVVLLSNADNVGRWSDTVRTGKLVCCSPEAEAIEVVLFEIADGAA